MARRGTPIGKGALLSGCVGIEAYPVTERLHSWQCGGQGFESLGSTRLNRRNTSIPSMGVEAFLVWGHAGGTEGPELPHRAPVAP
jgi:hypothetical protein